jgi:hypothetical protein
VTEQAGEGTREESSTNPLAQAARHFLEDLSAIEAMLQPLAGAGATAAFSLSPDERAFVGGNVLRFMGLVTSTNWEDVAQRLGSAGLTEDEISSIRTFAGKYRRRYPFFFRAYRTERGFENEITNVWARPIIYLRPGEFLVQLELYSHDKLAFTCHQELDDVVTLVRQLLEIVRDSLGKAADIRKDLPSEALQPEAIQEVVEAAEALYEFVPKPTPSSEKPSPPSEPDTPAPSS